jgi:ElaA protein
MNGGLIRWEFLPYDRLSTDALYDLLVLRQMVFVVEQHCAYCDSDGRDRHAHHLLGRGPGGDLLAYLRVVRPGARFPEPSIGRVVVHPSVRRTGLGKLLVREGLAGCVRLYPGAPIRISAQVYLRRFYEDLGFVADLARDPYDEDGIPHLEMVYGP